jgi:hypothetical protein
LYLRFTHNRDLQQERRVVAAADAEEAEVAAEEMPQWRR